MKKLLLTTALIALLATPLLAAAPSTVAVTQQVAGVSAMERMKAMKVSDVMRMKIQNPADFAATGIKDIKAGDEVEVKRQQDGSFLVKHMATDKTGMMKAMPTK